MLRALLILLALPLISPVAAMAQGTASAPTSNALPSPRTGEDVYRSACITCHGPDGKGSPKSVVGFDVDLPDFTDCAFASAEADLDWYSVVHEGSPIRGLGHHMPAFGDALSKDDIELAVSHVRTFCADKSWPRGDLNLPRAFFTEKAFPENEVVWNTAITGRGEKSVGNEIVYERRFGARNQLEVVVPLDFQQAATRDWTRGLGDVVFGYRRVLAASMDSGFIAAAGAEISTPTGNEALGLGNGYAIVEPFAMWGKILPKNAFLQMHGGFEVPLDSVAGSKEGFIRTASGMTFFADRGFGRSWTPQVEVLWARPEGGSSEWDIVPQLQVSLSRLQHVVMAAGVRVPLNERDERHTQVLAYLLWDWFDGSFFDFWK